MFVRLSAAIAALSLVAGAALAQGAKPSDPQIAHIAYTAGVIDIAAAKQAISKASSKDVKAFAEDMVRDHEAVNKQALDLVKKLKVTPEDNDTSKTLSKQAADKLAELGKTEGRRLRQGLCRQRGCLPQGRQRRAGDAVDPLGWQRRTEEPAANRPEDFSGPPAARRTRRRRVEVRKIDMQPGRRLFNATATALILGAIAVPAQAATIQIVMENLVMSPADATAKVGDTIEWINKDIFAHTATARNGDFDVNIAPKKTVTSVLKKAGTVEYYCRFHPNMKAVLTIEP